MTIIPIKTKIRGYDIHKGLGREERKERRKSQIKAKQSNYKPIKVADYNPFTLLKLKAFNRPSFEIMTIIPIKTKIRGYDIHKGLGREERKERRKSQITAKQSNYKPIKVADYNPFTLLKLKAFNRPSFEIMTIIPIKTKI